MLRIARFIGGAAHSIRTVRAAPPPRVVASQSRRHRTASVIWRCPARAVFLLGEGAHCAHFKCCSEWPARATAWHGAPGLAPGPRARLLARRAGARCCRGALVRPARAQGPASALRVPAARKLCARSRTLVAHFVSPLAVRAFACFGSCGAPRAPLSFCSSLAGIGLPIDVADAPKLPRAGRGASTAARLDGRSPAHPRWRARRPRAPSWTTLGRATTRRSPAC